MDGKPGLIELTSTDFDIGRIASCGQCFRITRAGDGSYRVIHGTDRLTVTRDIATGRHLLDCTPQRFDETWSSYFDLEGDYAAIRAHVDPADRFLQTAVAHGQGIRVLRQDLWEVMVSFIISQNNNIPRIAKSIDSMCSTLGEHIHVEDQTPCDHHGEQGFTVFPTAEKLTDESQLVRFGLGYRAPYVAHLAREVASGALDLAVLQESEDHELVHGRLMEIEGVGPKVAACIELFGLHHLEACPLDTWMRKVVDVHYGGTFEWSRYEGFEGVIQQYLFFYARHLGSRTSSASRIDLPSG